MNKEYKFSCGCSFPIENGKLRFIKDARTVWDDLNYDCKATWDIMSVGDSKGMFQIESSFGRQLCKKAPISNIDDLSHLIAAQRPGATQSYLEDKKSLSDHYFMRKAGQEEATPFHPALEPLLRDTQSILLYQEQAMAISMDIAGFTAVEADILRKAAGKKDSKLMASLKDKFIEGCVRVGKVKREEGEMIFSWLEASQRYSFNRCLSPLGLVETKSGIKTLDEVNVGEFVLAPGQNGDEFVEVVDKIEQGEQELYEISLESGKTIQCTLNHKFLCENGEILPLSDILFLGLRIMCEEGV